MNNFSTLFFSPKYLTKIAVADKIIIITTRKRHERKWGSGQDWSLGSMNAYSFSNIILFYFFSNIILNEFSLVISGNNSTLWVRENEVDRIPSLPSHFGWCVRTRYLELLWSLDHHEQGSANEADTKLWCCTLTDRSQHCLPLDSLLCERSKTLLLIYF